MGHSINLKSILSLLLAVCMVFALAIDAEAKKKRKRRKKRSNKAQWAFVVVDGAAVYQVPNFDSPILEYLDRDRRVRVSKKLYNGIGGLGAFYKVRLGKKKFGYITDVDLRLPKGGRSAPPRPRRPQQPTGSGTDPFGNQLSDYDEGPPPELANSIYHTRYVGLGYGSYIYTEEIGGKDESGATSFFGFKLSGPGTLLGGAPMDVEVFYTSEPEFYGDVYSSSSGFMLITSALFLSPLLEWPSFLVYYGAGMVVTYSNFEVNTLQEPTLAPIPSEEVRAGLAFSLGIAWRFWRKMVFRTEGKYFYEKETYPGFNAALQYQW